MDKLKWLSNQYFKQMDSAKIVDLLIPSLKEKGYIRENFDRKMLENSVHLFKGRITTLSDFLDWAGFLFIDDYVRDEEAREKHLTESKIEEFRLLGERFNQIESFDAGTTEKVFRTLVEELGIKASDLVHPVRVALTGRAVGPGLFETIAVLGKEKTVQRLAQAFT